MNKGSMLYGLKNYGDKPFTSCFKIASLIFYKVGISEFYKKLQFFLIYFEDKPIVMSDNHVAISYTSFWVLKWCSEK
jgi:hypothetical protein